MWPDRLIRARRQSGSARASIAEPASPGRACLAVEFRPSPAVRRRAWRRGEGSFTVAVAAEPGLTSW
jgi:hypothetical protein